MITGLSLSFCISDICRGLVKEEEVKRIIAGIMAENIEFLEEKILPHYAKTYWYEFPEKAGALALKFYKEGKINQPRLTGQDPFFTGDGHWLDENGVIFRIIDGQRVTSPRKPERWPMD